MIRYLLFDLDNTLYPRECGLEDAIGSRMSQFVSDYLGVTVEEAQSLRQENLRAYGTSLNWLISCHGLTDVESFLERAHPKDLSVWLDEQIVSEARETLEAINLPGSILTNAPIEHAERVLAFLGLRDRFEHLVDIRENQFKGKPSPNAYSRVMQKTGADIQDTLFLDDVVHYLLPFRDLGGQIVHVSSTPSTHRDVQRINRLKELVPLINTGEQVE